MIPNDIEIIKIVFPGQDSVVYLSDFVKNVKVIPLEFSDQSIIGAIEKMKVHNDRIYIHDRHHPSLLVFDIEGKFLYTIGSLGKGKEEYVDLTSFEVNDKGVFIYSYYPSEIHHYDYEGKYLDRGEKVIFQC